jgi:uncharacterized protein (TIGR03083 family)
VSRTEATQPGRAVADEAMRAFLAALEDVEATAPTWCAGWSAHEVASHVAAVAQERADLIEERLAGRPGRPTRSWEEREPLFRAMPDQDLRSRLADEALRFEHAVSALGDTRSIDYTGWTMTGKRLRTHSHSEAALHRWDLVGDDPTSRRLLSQPSLTSHALAVFDAMPALREAQRWKRPALPPGPSGCAAQAFPTCSSSPEPAVPGPCGQR